MSQLLACITITKKRARYTPSIAADWVLPSTEPDEVLLDDSLAETDTSQMGKCTHELHPSHPVLAAQPKQASRYKKALPSTWVEAGYSNGATLKRDDPIQAVRIQQPSSNGANLESPRVTSGGQSMHRDNQQRPDLTTSTPIRVDRAYGPTPQAPTKKTFSHLSEGTGLTNGRSQDAPLFSTSPTIESHKEIGGFRGRYEAQTLRHDINYPPNINYSTISPPVSVSHQSSETTASPARGRDLPARGPRMSPSYSDF